MHEADDGFLPIPSGVDKLLLQVFEELESGDRQELGWVWAFLQSSIHSGMYDHLILQVSLGFSLVTLSTRRCGMRHLNPKKTRRGR